MTFDLLILNIVLILSKKSFLKDLNCYTVSKISKLFFSEEGYDKNAT